MLDDARVRNGCARGRRSLAVRGVKMCKGCSFDLLRGVTVLERLRWARARVGQRWVYMGIYDYIWVDHGISHIRRGPEKAKSSRVPLISATLRLVH